MPDRELYACCVEGCNTLWEKNDLARVFPHLRRCPAPGCGGYVRKVSEAEVADLMMGPTRDMAAELYVREMRQREQERERLEQEKARREAEEAQRRQDEARREVEETCLREFEDLLEQCFEGQPDDNCLGEKLFASLQVLQVVHQKLRDHREGEFADRVVSAICAQVECFWPSEVARILDRFTPYPLEGYLSPGWTVKRCQCGRCAGIFVHRPCELEEARKVHVKGVEEDLRWVVSRGLEDIHNRQGFEDQFAAFLEVIEAVSSRAYQLGFGDINFSVKCSDGRRLDRPRTPGVYCNLEDPDNQGEKEPGDPELLPPRTKTTGIIPLVVDVASGEVWNELSPITSRGSIYQFLYGLPGMFVDSL